MEQDKMKKQRQYKSAEEKVRLLRLHLIEKQPVSKICEESGVAPTVFYRWQEALFANAALSLENKYRPERNKDQAKIEKLESQIRMKDATMAELLQEHVALKKELGEL
ncbi:MAG: transposase [Gammaproteobacteria bacterium]|nr:transposase [Gammaproteobacteria bacterium]